MLICSYTSSKWVIIKWNENFTTCALLCDDLDGTNYLMESGPDHDIVLTTILQPPWSCKTEVNLHQICSSAENDLKCVIKTIAHGAEPRARSYPVITWQSCSLCSPRWCYHHQSVAGVYGLPTNGHHQARPDVSDYLQIGKLTSTVKHSTVTSCQDLGYPQTLLPRK